MTSEKRFYRTDNVLGTVDSNNSTADGTSGDNDTFSIGIKVFIDETIEISGGDVVGIATCNKGATAFVTVTSTWTLLSNYPLTDSTVSVDVYGKLSSGPTWVFLGRWTTEILTDTQLDAATWALSFYIYRYRYSSTSYDYTWFYGESHSFIDNFTHSTPSGETIDFFDKFIKLIPQFLTYKDEMVKTTPRLLEFKDEILKVQPQLMEYTDGQIKILPRFMTYEDQQIKFLPQFVKYLDQQLKINPRLASYYDKIFTLIPKFQEYSDEFLKVYPQLTSYIDLAFTTLIRFTEVSDEIIQILPQFTSTFEQFVSLLPRLSNNQDIVFKAMPRLLSYSEQFIKVKPGMTYEDYTDYLFKVFTQTTAVLISLFKFINLGSNQSFILDHGGIRL